MVVAAFPVAKLGAIFIKQISKPLATAVKTRAKKSPFFRNYICMPPAQFYHWAEVRVKMWSMNLGKPVNIPKLNEAMAIELGAELVGEGLVFTIAAGILILEYMRSARKEAAKEEEKKEETAQMQADLKELFITNVKLEAQLREVVRILHINVPQSSFNPDVPNLESIPAHHRIDQPAPEESGGIINGLKGLVWNAIELILPTVDDREPLPQNTKNPPAAGSGETTTNTLSSTAGGSVSQKDAKQTVNNSKGKAGDSSLPISNSVTPKR